MGRGREAAQGLQPALESLDRSLARRPGAARFLLDRSRQRLDLRPERLRLLVDLPLEGLDGLPFGTQGLELRSEARVAGLGE